MNNGKELTNGSSCSPEYYKIFNREPFSRNQIREENPLLVIAVEKIVEVRQHHGQMTLPEPVGTADIIYPPIEFPHHILTLESEATGRIEMTEGLDYSLMQQ